MDLISDNTVTTSKRKRQIHQPIQVSSIGNYNYKIENPPEKQQSQTESPKEKKKKKDKKKKKEKKDKEKKRKTKSSTQRMAKTYGSSTKWDDFDNLAIEMSKEDIVSRTTGASLATGYKFDAPKLMPENSGLPKIHTDSRHQNKSGIEHLTNRDRNNRFDYQPYEYYDDKDHIPVSVIYEEVDTMQEESLLNANCIPPARFKQMSPNLKSQQTEDYYNNKLYESQNKKMKRDEFQFQMDRSLNSDIQKVNPPVKFNAHAGTHHQVGDEDTLDLSPINKSKRGSPSSSGSSSSDSDSKDDTSVDVQAVRGENLVTRHRSNRETVSTPVITPLFNPNSALVSRPTKYAKVELAKTHTIKQVDPKPIIKYKKTKNTRNTVKKSRSEWVMPKEGFKDLLQYSNFHDDLEEVQERYDEGDSRNTSNSNDLSKNQGSQYRRKEFYVPENSEDNVGQQPVTTKSNISFYSNAKSNASAVGSNSSKVRRYGRRKHQQDGASR